MAKTASEMISVQFVQPVQLVYTYMPLPRMDTEMDTP